MRVFKEKQKFTQWWLHLINIGVLSIMAYSCYQWFVLKEASGNVAADETGVQIAVIVIMALTVGFLYSCFLETTIDESGIAYRFFPFQLLPKKIYWKEMSECHTRTYKPILEYGGWGYRMSFGKGKALNVKGNKGIQIVYKNGKRLLLGTQQPLAAQTVINHYFIKTEVV
jgi:hypothetical protein